ncbi:unnamed protein product [Prorocentrum cordatum]|uniref:Uncharacterized protein n=1 Tax=Prorocentrum cordatum TaxID=2364126 RepID=A0ABN9WJH8_9DINO|nr:unnamed protein product [Polarella glacialis]
MASLGAGAAWHALCSPSLWLDVAAVLLPSLGVYYVVYAESKTVASLAQLSDMQERNEKQQLLASKAIKADKQWFCLGVSNLAITAYLLGAFPGRRIFCSTCRKLFSSFCCACISSTRRSSIFFSGTSVTGRTSYAYSTAWSCRPRRRSSGSSSCVRTAR